MRTLDDVVVRRHRLRDASDDELAVHHDLQRTLWAERRPQDPPLPLAVTIAEHRGQPEFVDGITFAAWAGDRVVGAAVVVVGRQGHNEHLVEVDLGVHPEWRRQGIGRRLLRETVALTEAEGRRLVMAWTDSAVPAGDAFAAAVGARAGLVERESELSLPDLDRALVERWVAEGPERAPGYELVWGIGSRPAELFDELARVYGATNGAPTDDLEVEDEHLTPEQLVGWEEARRAIGRDVVACYARERSTGRIVGFTELFWHGDWPTRVEQGWTAVEEAHRGHALGKWLKGAALLQALERWPAATTVVTENAYSNDAMLGINDALGFRETTSFTVWQATVDELRATATG